MRLSFLIRPERAGRIALTAFDELGYSPAECLVVLEQGIMSRGLEGYQSRGRNPLLKLLVHVEPRHPVVLAGKEQHGCPVTRGCLSLSTQSTKCAISCG